MGAAAKRVMFSDGVGGIVPVRTPCVPAGIQCDPKDAFVLSAVDGNTSLSDIAEIAALTLDSTVLAMGRLLRLGLLRADSELRTMCALLEYTVDIEVTPAVSVPATPRPAPTSTSPKAPRPLDPSEVEEIEELIQRTSEPDPFIMLGVLRDAPRKRINDAYLTLAAQCHPDRYFGRDLGALKGALEKAFVRATQASDKLLAKR